MLEQGKSEGFDSCDRPSNLTQIGFKSSIFQPVWPWNLMDDPKNNPAPLPYYFKLFASFHSHWWIQTGVTVQKRQIWVKFDDFFSRVTLKFDWWPSVHGNNSWKFLDDTMMGTWWKRCDGRTDRRTDWTSHIAAWSQLKRVPRDIILIPTVPWSRPCDMESFWITGPSMLCHLSTVRSSVNLMPLLAPDGIKPLPKPLLTSDHWHPSENNFPENAGKIIQNKIFKKSMHLPRIHELQTLLSHNKIQYLIVRLQ